MSLTEKIGQAIGETSDSVTGIAPVLDDALTEDTSADSERTLEEGSALASELFVLGERLQAISEADSVALEGYRLYAHSLLHRAGLENRVSVESIDNAATLGQQCHQQALLIEASLEAFESLARFIFPFRSQLGKLKDVEKRLGLAKRKLSVKIERLGDETTKIKHVGMYYFLMRESKIVHEPAEPLQESLEGLERMYTIASEGFEKVLSVALSGIKDIRTDEDVDKFYETMLEQDNPAVELYTEFKDRSLAILGNKRITFEEKKSPLKDFKDGKLSKSWAMDGTVKLLRDPDAPIYGTYVVVDENGEEVFDLEATVHNALHKPVKSTIPRSMISANILRKMVDLGIKAVADCRGNFEISDKATKTMTDWKVEFNKVKELPELSKESKKKLNQINRMCNMCGASLDTVMALAIKQMIYLLGGTAALVDVAVDDVR